MSKNEEQVEPIEDDVDSIGDEYENMDDGFEEDVPIPVDNDNEEEDNPDTDSIDGDEVYDEDIQMAIDTDMHSQSNIERVVPAEERITSDFLTRYEMVELLNARSVAIEKGCQCYVDTAGMTSAVDMAMKEILQNKCPLMVKRIVGDGLVELWSPNEMGKPAL